MSSTDFLQVVLAATGIATAVATGVSTALAIWWRRLDREEADWVIEKASSRWYVPDAYGNEERPHAETVVANAGDGTAYQVRFVGVNCRVWQHADAIPRGAPVRLASTLGPGQAIQLRVWCEPTRWDDAHVAVVWTAPPTWRRKRRVAWFRLSAVAARPKLMGSRLDPMTGEVLDEQRPEPDPPVLGTDFEPDVVAETRHWLGRKIIEQRLRKIPTATPE